MSQPDRTPSAASVCLQCGHRAVVPHGGGFKCRDCGTEEPYNPLVEAIEPPARRDYSRLHLHGLDECRARVLAHGIPGYTITKIEPDTAAEVRRCDVKGCGKDATERLREREKPHIGVPVCATHAVALTSMGDFYERGEPIHRG